MAPVSFRVLGWAAFSVVAIAFHASAYGRIGETLAQCENRYGRQIGEHNGSAGFWNKGYCIFVRFFEGRADAILFSKARIDTLDRPEPLSDDEIQLLLESSGGGRRWSASRTAGTGLRWSADDGTLLADYGTLDRCLVILTKEHVERGLGRAAARRENKPPGGKPVAVAKNAFR